ncbi:HAD family phosphatase [Amycolatopsis sp. Poz14]|uniref:HAD family hydrolase n=1 Tax=Amycolatopsis sp. Poz14 TaxID=1447705 RepID=UPI001EE87618|nr:haloacid dehalogenase-like hydrolase [Amycolatopsis sp. Poz14]MCG3755080.1 haloacid dehalogenase-like hydrolase [Amycolatopsis sp. Poz14]
MAAKNRCGRNPAAKYAILDLDGTLLPGHTSRHYLRVLLDDGACDRQAGLSCLEAIAQYAAAEKAPPGLLDEIYRLYALALKGASVAQARFAAEKTWRARRGMLFSFVPELLSLLRASGCRIHLLSGNHDFPVQEAAFDLGLSGGHGAVVEVADGRFTGRLLSAPGAAGGKLTFVRCLADATGFDAENSLAIGNSASDAEVFSCVGKALAFEPDAELRRLAAGRPWHVVDRRTILRVCARLTARATAA